MHVHVKLVGPKPRNFRIRFRSPRDDLADGDRLILCVLPGFEPDCAAQKGIEMPRYIARSEDSGIARSSELINNNAIIRSKARGFSKLNIRDDSDPYYDEVRLDDPTVCGPNRVGRFRVVNGAYAAVQLKIDTITTMQAGDISSEFGRGNAS